MLKSKQKSFSSNKQFSHIKRILIAVIFLIIGVYISIDAFHVITSSANEAFEQALDEQREATYQKFYQTSFEIAEKKNHVSNDVNIVIGDVREESQLEVLEVSDVEYVTHEEDAIIWTSVRGHGIYTIDLTLSEFIIDKERQYVLVRIPRPQLNTASLDYQYKNYLFENGIFNGNTSEGVNYAREDLKNAQNQLQEKLTSTQAYYESAEASAKKLVTSIIKNLNKQLPELVVEVEFVE